ncbi:hypothetical protein PGT21_014022 [Puccinia graminis f. sp. tritici]|nr:hypothetical protein PGT21_014022 [Puccinia graminis f. sp. tritici]
MKFHLICKILNERNPSAWVVNSRDSCLISKIQDFTEEEKEIWFSYWESQTDIDFRSHEREREKILHEFQGFCLPFLSYVEMMISIIPWPDGKGKPLKPLDYLNQLKNAHQLFKNVKGYLSNPTNNPEQLEGNLEEKKCLIEFQLHKPWKNAVSIIWNLIEMWLELDYKPLWINLSSRGSRVLSQRAKTFFNNVFFYGFEHLTILLQKNSSLGPCLAVHDRHK